MDRRSKTATQTGMYLVIVGAILVIGNIISHQVYRRFDLTKNERFTLSKGSARLVREGLDQPMQVDVYVTRGLPKHEILIEDLTDLMNAYERASDAKIHYTIIE